MFKSNNVITSWFFGIKKLEDKKLLSEILNETDAQFLKWALSEMNKCKPKQSLNIIRGMAIKL